LLENRAYGRYGQIMTTFIALLRGINVTGRNKIPMAELRSLAEGLGCSGVSTYIQSGNLVFQASGAAGKLETSLEAAILEHFKLTIPVVVRSAKIWRGYVAQNPFIEECETRPNLVHLALGKKRPKQGAVEGLNERAQKGERVVATGGALWIDYPDGSGTSKLTPALFDRLVGSPVTARNWRTVLKLESML
jgi:uncharacterized protein (DUF1697 family)